MVVVVGVDVVVVLLVPDVLLIAQFTVQTGVAFLLQGVREREGVDGKGGRGDEEREALSMKISPLVLCVFAVAPLTR